MMDNPLVMQLLTLSLYTLFMGFTFCDGFKLHTGRKLVWFAVFGALSIYSMRIKNEFDLTLILPVSIVLAIVLCGYEKIKSNKR